MPRGFACVYRCQGMAEGTPESPGEVDDWLEWVQTASDVVRSWEHDRGRMLPTGEAAALAEQIARALKHAAVSGRPSRRR